MWAVLDTDNGPRLCPQFVHGENVNLEELAWAPGRNTSSNTQSLSCNSRRCFVLADVRRKLKKLRGIWNRMPGGRRRPKC